MSSGIIEGMSNVNTHRTKAESSREKPDNGFVYIGMGVLVVSVILLLTDSSWGGVSAAGFGLGALLIVGGLLYRIAKGIELVASRLERKD